MKTITSRIFVVRGQRVILDADLATTYFVTTKALNQAVKRNLQRFPDDFAFQLTASDAARLKNRGSGSYPWVFTDRGALMAANVLHSKQAIQLSIHVVRAYVRLRKLITEDKGLAKLLDEMERHVAHRDEEITGIVRAIRELATPPEPRPRRDVGSLSGD